MATVTLSVGPTAFAATAEGGGTVRVVLNRKTVALEPEPVVIDRQAYLPLRAICELLGGYAQWNTGNRQATVRYNHRLYQINGVVEDDRMMVTPEEIGKVFGLNVKYEAGLSAVLLGYSGLPTQQQLIGLLPRYDSYNSEDLYWLSRIVEAEATGEGYESKLAVASVILNRMDSQAYPNTIKEVIFDKKHGVQFTPVSNGSVYNEPTIQSFLAAMDALEGKNNAPGALFFMNPQYATSFWMQENRQFAFTIGGHAYYY